jgi:hypothetical protein
MTRLQALRIVVSMPLLFTAAALFRLGYFVAGDKSISDLIRSARSTGQI